MVIFDRSLPDSRCLETLFRVREAAPEAPVGALSGLDDAGMALQALQNGAQDCLVKGQGDGDLAPCAIRYAIERIRAEERLAYLSQYEIASPASPTASCSRTGPAGRWCAPARDWTLVTLLLVDLDRFKADPSGLLLPGVGRKIRLPISRSSDSRSFRVVVQSGALVGVALGGILSGELCRCA